MTLALQLQSKPVKDISRASLLRFARMRSDTAWEVAGMGRFGPSGGQFARGRLRRRCRQSRCREVLEGAKTLTGKHVDSVLD